MSDNIKNVLIRVLAVAIVSSAVGLMGCASFDIETPEEMVVVEKSGNEYVAMTHDGIVLRALVHPREDAEGGGHDFWVKSVRERMRTRGGYALLDEYDVESADGHRGTRLEFGRDQDGIPYQYWITLFVTDDAVHVIDTGGRDERFDNVREVVKQAIASYEVRK